MNSKSWERDKEVWPYWYKWNKYDGQVILAVGNIGERAVQAVGRGDG